MPWTVEEIFRDNEQLERVEVIGYSEVVTFSLSRDARVLELCNANFARKLALLPGALTESGYVTDGGFRIRGTWDFDNDGYKMTVSRISNLAEC